MEAFDQPAVARPSLGAATWIALAGVAVSAVWMLNERSFAVPLILLGAAGIVIAWRSVRIVAADAFWLPCAVIVVEGLCNANIIPDGMRAALRYPLLLLFCAPVLPRVYK